ncbi:hypothetical protein NQZ68_024532 [Dissostichus eleginoides]|nr:hypothetical protein NQZ68_024532 [Dissostichus eleginoides]
MNDVFALGLGYSVMQAFEPTVIMEHEAVIGGFKCLYWLVKNEIAHHTNYPKLLSLAQLLGCDYFEKLKEVKDTRWLSQDLAVQNLQRNLPAVLAALAKEASTRRCLVAKGLYTFCATYRFVAALYLQADLLPHIAMLSKVFQRADVNFLHINEQVPVTLVTLGSILEAGETPLPGTFLARLHQDLDNPDPYQKDATVIQEWTSYKQHVLVGSFKDKTQAEIMQLLASEKDEWAEIYPNLRLLSSAGLVIPVSSVKTDLRNRLKGEHLAACLRIAVNGPAPEAFPYAQALELFFNKPRQIKCSDKQCHLCAH